ncbi:MAG: NUDIX hydrolase [Deltaproteobacteria bacterium]|nr:NUDIX hydrolase [Deltaproteobacteria bacterium]
MTPEAIAAWQARWGKGPHVTADVVVFTLSPDGRLSVLLIERGIPPFQGRYALPGGFVRLDEDLEAAARRELAEETGVTDRVPIDQLATFGAPGRDPRGRTVTVAYLALVPWDRVAHAKGGDDAAAARFFAIEGDRPVDARGRQLPLAFDHDEIVRVAVERLRGRVTYTTAPFALMPPEFTLSDLQHAYEAILGRELHRRAFRQRVEGEGWVVETGRTRGGAHRPARLFRAATRELLWMRPWPEAAKVTGGMKTRAPSRRKRAT